jgi:hypothetical protein
MTRFFVCRAMCGVVLLLAAGGASLPRQAAAQSGALSVAASQQEGMTVTAAARQATAKPDGEVAPPPTGVGRGAGVTSAQINAPAPAPPPRPTGRVSFYTHAARAGSGEAPRSGYAEFISSLTYELADREGDGLEYGIDLRHAASTVEGRTPRLSLYEGYVGRRMAKGALGLRVGHLWINDLGSLGAIAGGLVEFREPASRADGIGRWRVGAFGGLEPSVYDAGYVDGVSKAGGYVGLDGPRSRRHTLGYVRIRHGGLVERSALSFTNYVPLGRLSIYQAGEYDLSGPGGIGSGALTYLFANARASVSPRVEVLGTFSRGHSIDARSISEDILNGRPVSPIALEGLLYQSLGGRLTVQVLPRVQAYVGYSRDTDNRGDTATNRWLIGGYAPDLLESGWDLAMSDSRMERQTGSYHSTYLSLGRQLGRRLYLSGDYTSSLSVVRYVRGDGVLIQLEPHMRRLSASAVVNLTGPVTLLLSAEETFDDQFTELRVLSGLTYRLR